MYSPEGLSLNRGGSPTGVVNSKNSYLVEQHTNIACHLRVTSQ
jgi:hypothetical protein